MKRIFLLIAAAVSLNAFAYEIKMSDVKAFINSMTIKEKAYQLFFVCCPSVRSYDEFPGGIIPSKSVLKKAYIEGKSLSGEFINAAIPPFVGIDQEGGMVDRLSFAVKSPPIGEILAKVPERDMLLSNQFKIMKSLGVNVNFSPCVDLSYGKSTFINRTKRGISSNPDSVISFSRYYMKLHKKERILTTLKHFPGYGETYDNSDDFISPYKGTDVQLFENLRIFSSLLNDASFVMMANLVYPSLDTLPALMSRTIVSYVKSQDSMVIVLTDDIACRGQKNPFDALKRSFSAGCDMFILMDDTLLKPMTDSIASWVSEGKIKESEIDKRMVKILLKKEYLYRILKKD